MRARRPAVAVVAAALVLGPLAWLWQDSLLPASYAATGMGRPDHGGRPDHRGAGHGAPGGTRSVDTLAVARTGPADVAVELVARAGRTQVSPGVTATFTLNGTSPGPTIRARQGDLVEVRLVNESVPDGVTLHWHGVDVPNAADGVAGVTQDAVPAGADFTYRFVADRAGTYWYHSHQLSHEQVRAGLLGALVVDPAASPGAPDGGGGSASGDVDTVALVHLYGGVRTVNGRTGDVPVDAAPGSRVRVRVVNTDNGLMPVWVDGAPFRLVAIDGTDVHGATPVRGVAVRVTAGGRADLEVRMPDDGSSVRVAMGGSAALVLSSGDPAPPPGRQPAAELDPLTYGTPADVGFDPERPTRRFEYTIGRRPGFVDGVPGVWWTVNGRLYPDVPMFMVSEGDVVRMRITNRSNEVHPMHLHGHHALVVARDGVPATGSPWMVDSLDVGVGESYDIAFLADNPGIWTDHCHNLTHAAEGLVAHLMYDGVTTPYRLDAVNRPE